MEILTNRQTNGQNYTNFASNLALMVIYIPVKIEFDGQSVFESQSGKRNLDRQTKHGITPISKAT